MIGDKDVMLLVDTGASVSVISWTALKSLLVHPVINQAPADLTIQGAGGSPLPIRGITTLNLTFNGGHLVSFNFVVLDSLAVPVIIGADFLAEHRVDISMGRQVLAFPGWTVPFAPKAPPLLNSTTIPIPLNEKDSPDCVHICHSSVCKATTHHAY